MSHLDADVEIARKKLLEAEERRDIQIVHVKRLVKGACFKTVFYPGYNTRGFECMDKVLEVLPDNSYGNSQVVGEHLWWDPQHNVEGAPGLIDCGISTQHEYPKGYGYLSDPSKVSVTPEEYQALRKKILDYINKGEAH